MTSHHKEIAYQAMNGNARKILGILLLSLILALISSQLFGATFVAYNTGNWSSRSTWITTKTGTITTNNGSKTVTGSGTAFTTELQVGDKIYRSRTSSFSLVGTVASITSNTSLTLVANAAVNLSNNALFSHGLPTATDDIQIGYLNGTVATILTVDGNYTCNLMTFVDNGGVAYTVDIPSSKSLTITGYGYLVADSNNGDVCTLNVSGTLSVGGLYLHGSNNSGNAPLSQLTIQDGGTVNITGNVNIYNSVLASKAIVSSLGTGTLNLGGNFISTSPALNSNTPYTTPPTLTPGTSIKSGTISFASTSVFNLNGSNILQVLPVTATTVYGHVYFNNTGSNVATLNGNITASNVLGDLKIQSGTFTSQGASSSTTLRAASSTYTISGNVGNTFESDNGTTFKVAGTMSFPTGFGTITLQSTSTVDYIGTTQTISPQNFGNLTVSAGASAGRAVTLSSTGNIGIFSSYTPSTTNNVYTLTGSTVTYNGTSAQTIGAAYTTNFNNLIIANTGSGVTLNSNTGIAGDLTVSTSTFDLGAYTANRGSAGGTITVANNATLKIGGTNTFPSNYSTNTLLVASTVEYAGTNQAVANQSYGNLTLSSSTGAAVKTFPGTAMTVAGNLTSTLGSGSSVSFTAAANITVDGSTTIGASTTFSGGSYTSNIGGNWVNNGTFNGNTGTVIFFRPGINVGGSGVQNFNNVTVSASSVSFSNSSITLTGNLATTGSGSFSQASGGTLLMTGSGKTISGTGITLDNLTVSGSISTSTSFEIGGNLSVSGSFTGSAGTVTMSGSSKTMSGSGISFNDLFISGSISTSANFSIASGLSVNGSLSASAGTATFTGTSGLSGTANLYNATINGTSLQLSSNSTLGIANLLTITAGTLDVSSTIPNTVNFNSSGAQNINAMTYGNLILSNGNTKTALGSIITNEDLTIGSGTTFNPSTYTHSLYGSWINNGTFNAGSSTIELLGSTTVNISGVTTFNILTINTSGPTTETVMHNNISAGIINLTNGEIVTGTDTLTITNTRTGNGEIYGIIKRTHAFTTGVAYAFEGQYNTITFTSVTGVTSLILAVRRIEVSDFPSGSAINEVYEISVPTGTYNATLRLDYEDDELNGNDEATMGLWNYNGSSWVEIGKTGNNTTNNYIEHSGLTNITNLWTCGVSGSKVVQWNGSVSTDWHTANNWTVTQGAGSRPPSSLDIVELGTTTFTHQPTINNSESVNTIIMGSAQAVTLTLASGGSLTTTGNIHGTWSSDAIHTINVNNQDLTINGKLILSDGVVGQSINLNIGSGTVSVFNTLIQTGGANINFSGSGTISLNMNFDYTSGDFNAGSGTVEYIGEDNEDLANITYHNLTIDKPSGNADINAATNIGGDLLVSSGDLYNYSTVNITGNITIASGVKFYNNGLVNVGGDWTNSGGYAGTGADVKFDGTGTQNITATTFNNIVIDKPVGSSVILTGNVVVNGDLTVTSGTLDIGSFDCNRSALGGILTLADSATLIVSGNNVPANFSNSSFANASTLIANGTNPQNISGVEFGNLIFRNGGLKTLTSPVTVNRDLTIESGATLDGSSETITLKGNWVNSGTFTPSTSTVVCAGTSKTIAGNTTFNRLTVTGSYTILNNTTHNGLLNITNTGSLSGGNSIQTTLHGDLINRGTLYSLGTTTYSGAVVQTLSLINAVTTVALTVNFNGSVPPVLNSTSAPQFGYININNTGGITPSVGWSILYSMTIGSGSSFNGGNFTHNFLGSVTNNGTITSSGILNFIPATAKTVNLGSSFSNTGTVVFGGAGAMTFAGTPTSFQNVVIANTNGAGITPSSDWTINNNLTINSGATLNAGSHSYLVDGEWINNGTFNPGTSTVEFSGTATQSMSGTSATNFYNITVSNTANPGVSVQSNQNLWNVLTLGNNVVFDADGSSNNAVFTLISSQDNPTADASIGVLPSGAMVSGNVTVQRYMTKEGKNSKIYRYLSSPLQNATAADIQHEIPITGKFTGKSVCAGCGTSANMYYYDESVITDLNKDKKLNSGDGYITFPTASSSETLQPGRGYSLHVLGNLLSSTAWDVQGNINAGNFTPVSIPVSYTSSGTAGYDGWNLIGNPFPATIDWSASSGWTKTNLENAIYITDNGTGLTRFATWNGLIGTNGGSPFIATGQAFWIKADGSGTPVLTANEHVKAAGTQTTFFRMASLSNILRITLIKGTVTDETVIHFRPDATTGFDKNVDARKMMNATFNLSSVISDGSLLAINSLPDMDCNSVVKLSIDNVKAGTYQLSFKDVSTFSNGAAITLSDKFTKKTVAIAEGSVYNFSVTTNAASFGSARFELNFSSNTTISDFTAVAQTICENLNAGIKLTQSQQSVLYQAILNGSAVSAPALGTGSEMTIVINKQNLAVGQNLVTIQAVSSSCSTTILKKDLVVNVTKNPVVSGQPALSCESASLVLKAHSSAPATFNWFDSESAVTPDTQHDSIYVTPLLTLSKTYFVSVVGLTGCESQRVAVQAEIGKLTEAVITETNGVLTSSYASHNQWYWNNSLLPDANGQTLAATNPGVYKVVVSENGCSTSAEFNYDIAMPIAEDFEFRISAFPNPVNSILTIEARHTTEQAVNVTVFNSLGQVMGRVELKQGVDSNLGEFDMANQLPGMYFVRAIVGGKVSEIKVIRE